MRAGAAFRFEVPQRARGKWGSGTGVSVIHGRHFRAAARADSAETPTQIPLASENTAVYCTMGAVRCQPAPVFVATIVTATTCTLPPVTATVATCSPTVSMAVMI